MPRSRNRRRKQAKQNARQAENAAPAPTTMAEFEAEQKEKAEEVARAKAWLESLTEEDVISRNLFDPVTVQDMKTSFQAGDPFPHQAIQNFLDPQFAAQLAEEVKSLDFNLKKNDLYEFVQSKDLNDCKLPLVSKFRDVLYSEKFRQTLQGVTGLKLKKQVDMFAAVYENGHHLLPHDDQLTDRAVAFIMYFVPPAEEKAQPLEPSETTETTPALRQPEKKQKKQRTVASGPWTAADGGALDLFLTDENNQAGALATRLVPTWNSFVFFEVSARSFHQVQEVTSNKLRLTIGGWFHGRRPRAAPLYRAPGLVDVPLVSREFKLADWLNREYRKMGTVRHVNRQFCEDSSIELHNFLKKDVYAQVCQELLTRADWKTQGPRNRCLYDTLDAQRAEGKQETGAHGAEGALVDNLRDFLSSTSFANFLGQITGLEFSGGSTEVRRFGPGSYTLAHDLHPEWDRAGLDLTMCLLPPQAGSRWSTAHGGTVHYIAKGQEEELLSVYPRVNCLSIVYRNSPGAFPFVKYVNHQAPTPRFDINVMLRVPDSEDMGDSASDESDDDMPVEKTEKTAPSSSASASSSSN